MSNVKRVAKNTGWIVGGRIITGLIALGLNVLIARHLGVEIFGHYSFILAYIAFFAVLANLGIDTIVIRDIARTPKKINELINNSFVLKTVLSGIAALLAIIIIQFLPYPQAIKTGTIIAALTLILMAYGTTFTSVFHAKLQMSKRVIADIISKLVFAALVFYIIATNGGLVRLLIALFISMGVTALVTFLFARRSFDMKFTWSKSTMRYLFREGWPLALISVFTIIYFKIDIVMLSLMRDAAEVGYYSAAYQLIDGISIFATAFVVSVYPLLSQYYKASKKSFNRIYSTSFKYLAIVALPLAVGTTLISRQIIHVLYGVSFVPAATALSILIWAAALVFIYRLPGLTLSAIGQQKAFAKLTATAAILNIVLNLFIIPLLGFIGASITTLITEVFLFSVLFWKFRSESNITLSFLVKLILCVLLMGIFVYFIKINIIILVLAAIIIYFVLAFVLRLFEKEDIALIRRVFKK